ncbi:conjugative transposon protein TraK [Pinibacter aurantiacus]|uniref:Conjugative transposon protein TraK n=1 Tax=Pinibacter aurantiacus TaxID=2851599 RepID=A0A9E2W8P1_9BACT|nr:conjugative transposon protein TraK [Pinibacter aurantiacus]MBV4358801.1 conjugative transposon protein TraK [Pinibacter aurantiacus]
MFTKMKNIDTAFKYIRLFTLLIILGCLGLCVFVFYKSYALAASTQNKIYVLANEKALEAISTDRKTNISVEAKDHVKMFHLYFFTLDPDDKVIHSNITKALYLADASAKRQYDNLKENGFYSNIIAGNISQQLLIDSVTVNTNDYPYFFECYAQQKIIRTTSIVYRSLITSGYLRNVSRSENNSHGFLIERWTTLENKDIKTQPR